MKISKFIQTLFITATTTLIIVSCSNDDSPNPIDDGNILLSTTVVNTDGQSGSSYIQLISNLTENTYDNKLAFPFTFFHKPVVIGNYVYELPYFGENKITKYEKTANGLSNVGSMQIEESSNPSGLVIVNDTKAYLSLMGKGKIVIFNPTTMKKTSEIDVTSYGIGDKNPDPANMILRGDLLYVGLGQSVGGFFPDANRPNADVLIINTTTDTVDKMITESTTGISTPTRPNDHNSIFMDESNNIYISCIAGFGARPTHKTGLLRIKNGETEFDSSWNFPIESVTINGESKAVDYIQYLHYAGNGQVFAILNVPSFYSNPVNYLNDKTCVPVKIDLNTKSVTAIDGLPRSNSYCSVTQYNEFVVFGLDGANDSGYFTYNINTNKASTSSVIKVSGAPTGLYQF